MEGDILTGAVVYLAAAVICVPVAKRLGLSSVLGYLIAGMIIGPFVLGFVGRAEGAEVMHVAEFGVVMMLFLIGLELEPEKFWRMRKMVFGLGLSQVLITAAILFGMALLWGLGWRGGLAVGLAFALSSTAIVLQTLKEKNQLNTSAGQSSFAVLLFQDIAVIPILALLPLLAVEAATHDGGGGHGGESLLSGLPGWLQTLAVLGSVGVIILAGRYLMGPFLRLIAKTRLREIFTASALLIVVAIAYLMQQVGLSPALGTFLGGVVLANSPYRHELESDLDPFKGLLLGLFFIAVGASINFELILGKPVTILAIVLAVMVVKGLILFILGRVFKLSLDQNLLFTLGLAQVGEFGFVLFTFIEDLHILPADEVGTAMAVIAISMTLTPLLMLVNEHFIQPYFGTTEEAQQPADTVEDQHPVIIAGFAHFGSTVGRFLRANGVEATILDNDSDRVDLLRSLGFKVYYGDATRVDLLRSAGAENARILVSAIDEPSVTQELVENVQKHFPHLQLMVRAKNRYEAYDLLDMGLDDVYRESLDTSVRLGVDVLRKLGHRTYSATRLGQNFLKYDEAALRQLAPERHDYENYIQQARQSIAYQEQLLQCDMDRMPDPSSDHAWDSEPMRAAVESGED
jgi:CPA2 family monovalent cation:H+ antiporter-2